MTITNLNDRIELSGVYPITSSIGTVDGVSSATAFLQDNDASSFTMSADLIGPVILTDTTNNPIKIFAVNQQTLQRYTASYSSDSSTVYGSDWEDGYYRIYVRQYVAPTNGISTVNSIDNCSFYELTKKDLYWNKSMLSFMTKIQPGTFWMGSPEGEYGRVTSDDREKLHKVTLTEAFYISRVQLTYYFWNAIMAGVPPVDAIGSSTELRSVTYSGNTYPTCFTDGKTPGWYNGSTRTNNPRVYLTYAKYNATPTNPTSITRSGNYTGFNLTSGTLYPNPYITGSFFGTGQAGAGEQDNSLLRVLETKLPISGYVWDLPTEAQWEYVCRASTPSAFNNGENLKFKTNNETGGSDDIMQPNINEICWYNKHNNNIHPPAMLKPNKWGLFDMHGNVWEWVKDWYTTNIWNMNNVDPDFSNLQSGVTNRVLRGGSFSNAARHARSANRYLNTPSATSTTSGFRLFLGLK